VTVDTAAVASLEGILGVLGKSSTEQFDDLLAGNVGVDEGLAKGGALVGDGTGGFGTALLELASGGGLVGGAVLAVHLEVGQLDDHLDVGIRAALELLDQALAVALEGLDDQLVRVDLLAVVLGRNVDGLVGSLVEVECDGFGVRQLRAHGFGRKVDLLVEDEVVDMVA